MESKDVTLELNVDMEGLNVSMSEMVRILGKLVSSLELMNESVYRIDSSLAEIRKFLILGA